MEFAEQVAEQGRRRGRRSRPSIANSEHTLFIVVHVLPVFSSLKFSRFFISVVFMVVIIFQYS